MPAIGYLFAGAPDDFVLHEESARALLPTPYTYVLHGDGLAVRVAGLDAVLPLQTWRPGLVRDLQAVTPDVAGAVCAAIARGVAPSPPGGGAAPCYTVARDPRHPLRAAVGPYWAGMAPPAHYSYIVAANGVFVWMRSETFEAFVPIASFPEGTIWGLHALTPGARLLVPRLPAEILADLVAEARREAEATGHELLWQVCWREGAWVVVTPTQTNRRGSVSYDPVLDDGVIKVHSHGRHGTFWSVTDDRDERHAEFNIIVGDLHAREGPALLCRVGVYGRTLDVPAATVIEGDLPARDRYGDGHGAATPPGGADDLGPDAAAASVWTDDGLVTDAALDRIVAAVLARALHLIGDRCAHLARDHGPVGRD